MLKVAHMTHIIMTDRIHNWREKSSQNNQDICGCRSIN